MTGARRFLVQLWEVVMEPPVNLVLPVAEGKVDEVREGISATAT